MQPICGLCGAVLLQETHNQRVDPPLTKNRFNICLNYILITLIVVVAFGIMVTPNLMRKDFSLIIATEAQKTELLKEEYEKKLAAKKTLLEKELRDINPRYLKQEATKNYKVLLEARKSFDKRFALSPREKAQLRMRNLSSDSTKSFHDAIRSVAREASPAGADINPTTIHITPPPAQPVFVSCERDTPDGFSSVPMRQGQ